MSERQPARIQRQRRKGWRMPEGVVYVGRPTRWGNPFTPDGMQAVMLLGERGDAAGRRAAAVKLYRLWLTATWSPVEPDTRDSWQCALTFKVTAEKPTIDAIRAELRGKDLACWCPLSAPCHADVLLDLANAGARP